MNDRTNEAPTPAPRPPPDPETERNVRLLLNVKEARAYRLLGYPTFEGMCVGLLGFPRWKARQLMQIDRRLRAHPALRAAFFAGRLTLGQAGELASLEPEEVERRLAQAGLRGGDGGEPS